MNDMENEMGERNKEKITNKIINVTEINISYTQKIKKI